jgi:hypothetical protein
MGKKSDIIYKAPFICTGPDRRSSIWKRGGSFVGIGEITSISKCLGYPECFCKSYYYAADEWEAAQEEEMEPEREGE